MMEHVGSCPLCAFPEHTLFDRREFRGRLVENRLCRRCGLVFQSPRMDSSELERFYADEYRRLYQGAEGPSKKDLVLQRKRAASLLAFLNTKIPPISRHLDIGSSAGLLLQTFHQAYAAQAIGVEPGASYRQYSQGQGLQVYDSLETMQISNPGWYDLITLAHVLEHLPDPLAYLQGLREKYLHPSGWLLLEVPNLYAHDSFEVAHLSAFSAHTLRQMVQCAGYRVVAIRKHGAPRSRLLPLYLTMLARPAAIEAQPALRPERFVPQKRRLGLLRRRILSRILPDLAWIPV